MSVDKNIGYVSNTTLVLKRYLDQVQTSVGSDLKFIYDEELSYESAIKRFKDRNNLSEDKGQDKLIFPLLAFKRSPIRHSEIAAPGRRIVSDRSKAKISSDSGYIYKTVHGEFDLEFVLIEKDIYNFECQEISFLAEHGISKVKEFTVEFEGDLSSQNGLNYYVINDPVIDAKEFSLAENYYKYFSSKVTIRGFFMIFNQTYKYIKEVKTEIKEFNKNVTLSTITKTT